MSKDKQFIKLVFSSPHNTKKVTFSVTFIEPYLCKLTIVLIIEKRPDYSIKREKLTGVCWTRRYNIFYIDGRTRK